MADSFRFLRRHRLKTAAEFDRVFACRCSAADERLVVYVAANELGHPRLGRVVGRKVGQAVVRNRWRRLIREAFRLGQHQLPAGFDLVVVPRIVAVPSLAEMQASLLRLADSAVRNKSRKGGPAKSKLTTSTRTRKKNLPGDTPGSTS